MTNSPFGFSRRRFLQTLGATGAAGSLPWLAACGGGNAASAQTAGEQRTLYFNLRSPRPGSSYHLLAWRTEHALVPVQQHHLTAATARGGNLQLRAQAGDITHVAEGVTLPVGGPQLLFVRGRNPALDGKVHLQGMYLHVPRAGTQLAAAPGAAGCCPPGAAAAGAVENFCQESSDFLSYFEMAKSIVATHPEICCFDATQLDYIFTTYLCSDPNFDNLAESIYDQGDATTTPGGWATLVQATDPSTGAPLADKKGEPLYTMAYSDTTQQLAALAIASVLRQIKNDRQLGANITDLDATVANAGLQGKLWVVHDGSPTARPGTGSGPVASASTSSLALRAAQTDSAFVLGDVSAHAGYTVESITADATDPRAFSFTVNNWYARHLGMYVRFLDANGAPIALADIADNSSFPLTQLNGTYDGFLGMVNGELLVFGIPVQSQTQSFTVKLPPQAASCLLLAGGIGYGNSYPETVKPGAVMTGVLDLGIPGMFLAAGATLAIADYYRKLQPMTAIIASAAQTFVTLLADTGVGGSYNDLSVYKNLIAPMAGTLIKAAPQLYKAAMESMGEGEAEAAASDALGFGVFLTAASLLGTAAQIIETSVEVAKSPATFSSGVTFTHTVDVTINHALDDPLGFPSEATHYEVIATCDNASPTPSGAIALPGTTQTKALVYRFTGLPFGGTVSFTVRFYSDTGWLAAVGTTGPMSGLADTASITITNILVPLTSTTTYGHKQKIIVDGSGNHVWQATTTAPAAAAAGCANQSSLCDLVGITVSEPNAAVGYAWQSASPGVRAYVGGATGQLYQVANLSLTDTPQAGWLAPTGGFAAPTRIAYDRAAPQSPGFYLDTTGSTPIVRRVGLRGVDLTPSFDAPGSNRAVGKLNFASDALLVHPTGKLFSLNAEHSMIEVLVPAASAVADSAAPLAVPHSGPGTREGLINGPVSASISADGTLYVLEQGNNRIQAFDCGMNPVPNFGTSYFLPLKQRNCVYLDLTVEAKGYIYVLVRDLDLSDYVLDIYKPDGTWLTATRGLNAAKIALDLFRNLFTLNYESLSHNGFVEPSISQWIPSTP